MEEKIIEFVKENEFLYSKSHKHHKNSYLRDKAFGELSKKTNVPARRLKARWRTLRDKFKKEMKNDNLSSGPRKKWKWLDDLMFLKNENSQQNSNSPLEDFTMDNLQDSYSESVETAFPFVETSVQTNLSDNVLDVMEEVLGDVNNGISQVVEMAKDVLAAQVERKTAAQLFFESIAKQTDDANLSTIEFTHLQMEMLATFKKFFMERHTVKVEI